MNIEQYTSLLIGALLAIVSAAIGAWINHLIRVRLDRKEKERDASIAAAKAASSQGGELLAFATEVYRQYFYLHCIAPKIRTEELILQFIPAIESYASFSSRVNAMDTAQLQPHKIRALEGFKTHTCWLFLLMSTDSDTRQTIERQNQMAEALNQMHSFLEIFNSSDGGELPIAERRIA